MRNVCRVYGQVVLRKIDFEQGHFLQHFSVTAAAPLPRLVPLPTSASQAKSFVEPQMVLHRIPLSEKICRTFGSSVVWPLFFFFFLCFGWAYAEARCGTIFYMLYDDFMIGYLTAAAATRGGITQ